MGLMGFNHFCPLLAVAVPVGMVRLCVPTLGLRQARNMANQAGQAGDLPARQSEQLFDEPPFKHDKGYETGTNARSQQNAADPLVSLSRR